jgi:hypothetical protein
MRLLARVVAPVLSLGLGVAVATAAVATHRSPSGELLAITTTLVVMWAIRTWLARAVPAFAVGWSATVLVAVAGRGEGDYAVSSDTGGWVLIGFALVVLVTGVVWARPAAVSGDSAPRGTPT